MTEGWDFPARCQLWQDVCNRLKDTGTQGYKILFKPNSKLQPIVLLREKFQDDKVALVINLRDGTKKNVPTNIQDLIQTFEKDKLHFKVNGIETFPFAQQHELAQKDQDKLTKVHKRRDRNDMTEI